MNERLTTLYFHLHRCFELHGDHKSPAMQRWKGAIRQEVRANGWGFVSPSV